MNVTAMAISSTSIMVTWTHPMFMNTIADYFVVWEPIGLPSGVALQGGSTEILCDRVNLVRRKRTFPYPPCTTFTSFNITGLEENISL